MRSDDAQLLAKQLQAEATRHEQVESALRQRAAHLQLVLDASQVGTWQWDRDNDRVTLDERAMRLLGVQAPIVARTEMLAAIDPDDADELADALRKSTAGRNRFEHEFRVPRPDGGRAYLLARGDVIRDSKGAPSRLIGVLFDVTHRRRRQEELKLRDRALQSTTDGVVITSASAPEYPVIYVNPAFERITGYSAKEVLGTNLRFLQGPGTNPKKVEEIREGLASGAGAHVTILNYRKNGTAYWNDLQITPLRNSQGTITHYIGVQADVTQRQEFEQTLLEAQRRALAASDAKSEFLANMSHEIRTPLSAVLGCADTLYPRLEREEHREVLQMIRSQGRVLLGILNDILDLSKIEAGRLEVFEEECSIVSVIAEVVTLLQPQAVEKGLDLKTGYQSRMPALMLTDPLRVRQILTNLVGNAIKFTDAGEVVIDARCVRTSNPPTLLIEVRDTGIGIPPDRLTAVFEAFNQLSSTPTRRAGGTGLGLTISQQLVSMLGGKITVESQVGLGTSFTVALPVRSSQNLLFEQAAGLADAASEQHRSRDSINIMLPVAALVAEDTRGIQFMIRRMLEDAGATVAVVENGERAVGEVLKAQKNGHPFDVVVMDMQMPIMTGFDATARLRSLGVDVPIIALTAAAMKGDREKCLMAGCDEYLSKPVDRYALLDAVSRQYTRNRTRRADDGTPQ